MHLLLICFIHGSLRMYAFIYFFLFQELQYGDGGTLIRNRDLEDCLGTAHEQMEIVEGLIREMRAMGQPCENYHRRYYLCFNSRT